jgi:HPt (histidine-containing phosphotransfer) domain-containing protein
LTEAVDHRVLAALSQATGDDPAFLAELIDTYLADAPDLLVMMRDAAAAREAAGLRRAAHTLKSASATLGAHRLADLCRRLEHAEGPAETLVAQAEDEYLRVRVDLQAARPPT